MLSDNEMPVGRIEVVGQGVGELDSDLVARRAAEIATTDGRREPNERDFEEARNDLAHPGREQSPEERAGENLDQIVAGASLEEMAVDQGRGPDNPFEPDDGAGAMLFQEGLEEADHDQRLQSAREQDLDSLDLDE